MGKLLITSNENNFKKLSLDFFNSGFMHSKELIFPNIQLKSYKKLNIDTVNYWQSKDDYIFGVGTFTPLYNFSRP